MTYDVVQSWNGSKKRKRGLTIAGKIYQVLPQGWLGVDRLEAGQPCFVWRRGGEGHRSGDRCARRIGTKGFYACIVASRRLRLFQRWGK